MGGLPDQGHLLAPYALLRVNCVQDDWVVVVIVRPTQLQPAIGVSEGTSLTRDLGGLSDIWVTTGAVALGLVAASRSMSPLIGSHRSSTWACDRALHTSVVSKPA